MQNLETNIKILGNGKFTDSLTNGLLLDYKKSDITVIGARESSNLSLFENLGVNTSKEIGDLSKVSDLILTVTPQGSGHIISRLKNVDLSEFNGKIISFVSGLSVDRIIRNLNLNAKVPVIQVTANTNIRFGKGRLCSAYKPKVLRGLGWFQTTCLMKVLPAIVVYGAGNALNGQALLVEYTSRKQELPFRDWLEEFLSTTKEYRFSLGLEHLYDHEKFGTLYRYIGLLNEIYINNKFYLLGMQEARKSMESTVEALLSMDNLTIDSIAIHNKNVVTDGGCTEKGVCKIVKPEDLLSRQNLNEAVSLIWNRTKDFREDVKKSFELAGL